MTESIHFEEKVDFDYLVLPSKPSKMGTMEILDVKEEPFEENRCTAFESVNDRKKQYKLKIKETILKLYEELDREKYENPMMDFSQRRSLRIREVVEKLELPEKIEELESVNKQMAIEIVSLKAKVQMAKIYPLEKNHEVKPFSCKYCDKSFSQVHEVKEHIKIHASIMKNNDETTNSTETTISTDGRGYVTNNGLKTAEILEENLEVENNNQSKFRPDFVNLVKIRLRRKKVIVKSNDSEQKVESNKNAANLNNINLKQSMKTKSRKMPYLCRFCKKRFIKKDHWEEHERMHTGERPFPCETCKKSFKTKNNLKTHKRIHTGEKPYSCKYCCKAFNQSGNWFHHELSHTGAKPYSCKYCSKSFNQSTNLTRHHKLIHGCEKIYSNK